MSRFGIYQASVPVFISGLSNMRAWLDRATTEGNERSLLEARLAPDMRPLTSQYQTASDTAKNALGRLTGTEAPPMPDTEASFAQLQTRCDKTIQYLRTFDAAALDDRAELQVELKYPNGMGYRFTAVDYLTGFALPNFFFHLTAAYAILRNAGIPLGKAHFLQHLGQPKVME